jgi:hypothetical protein
MISGSGVQRALSDLAAAPVPADDAARIDEIRLLEELKAAAAARQARTTAAFAASQRAAQAAAGMPADRIGQGIARQVGLARRLSPYHAARYVGWATILTSELPATFGALAAGQTTEWRAMLVARETAWLSREHRLAVDREVGQSLERFGDRRVETETRKAAYRLDPHGFVERIRAAAAGRWVGVRPAADGMCRLTATLPVAQGVGCYAALARHADTTTAAGDQRGRGQIMADTLVERLTGQQAAGDVPVEINLVMTDQTLLSAGPRRDEPAQLLGYGPVPPEIARDLVYGPSAQVPRWLRRLYTAPDTGELVALESRRRCFTAGQRRYVQLRDRTCRTPWCDAPIRHIDHLLPHADGGPTDVRNAAGSCAACNYNKDAPGWATAATRNGEIVTTTPPGRQYRSRAPDLPGATVTSGVERRLVDLVFAA